MCHMVGNATCTIWQVGGIYGGPVFCVEIKKCPCRMLFRLFMPMSHVDFKKCPCPLSLFCLTSYRMSLGFMSL